MKTLKHLGRFLHHLGYLFAGWVVLPLLALVTAPVTVPVWLIVTACCSLAELWKETE
jgi:hypothetical protein